MPEKKQSPLDRLSALPDDILVHILSLLPTRLSVCTGVLSRRWGSLWAHVPHLSFGRDHKDHDGNRDQRLADFITKVVSAHKGQTVYTFLLTIQPNSYDFEIKGWIAALVSRNVRNISIDFSDDGGVWSMIPNCLLMCETLVELSIGGTVMIPTADDNVCLPALKRLRLERAESLPHLISGCPVLEELSIVNSDTAQNLEICSQTLQRLKLDIHPNDEGFGGDKYWVKLLTPTLRFLSIFESAFDNISFETLGMLVVADVDFGCYVRDYRCILDCVGKLCNLRSLDLCPRWNGIELPDSAFSALTVKFHNLIQLELTADWRFISFFLENADNLQVLTIRDGCWNIEAWREPHQVPTCLSSHLKNVTIEPDEKCTEGWLFISYVLRNAEVLKLMKVIKIPYYKGFELDALKEKILQLKLGSTECEIKLQEGC